MRIRILHQLRRSGLYLAVAIVAFWTLAPFYWIFVTSVSSEAELLSIPPQWWPSNPVFYRYKALLTGMTKEIEAKFMPGMLSAARKFKVGLKNSLLVAFVATIISLGLAIPAAYAFARLRFPLREPMFAVLVGSRMIPPVAIIVPLYTIFMRLQMLDSLTTLIILDVGIALPLMLWILLTYFRSLPQGLEEQGMIDGCTRIGVLLRIMLPISLPGIIAGATVGFITVWNEFFYALIFTETTKSETLPKLIAAFSSQYGGMDYGLVCAAGVLAILPPVLVAMLLQRYILSGLTAGALK